jgi:integrase/recombinase XerD
MSGTRMNPGPLGRYVGGYREWLLQRGYSPDSANRSRAALGHLGRWMALNDLGVDQLDNAAVTAFLADHRDTFGRLPTASVLPLLAHLREEGVVGEEVAGPVTPLDGLLDEYVDWLLHDRELAPVTIRSYVQLARTFLQQRVSPLDELGVAGLTGPDVTGFLLRECSRVRHGSAGCYANRLRSLLRYLSVRGLAHPGVVACVPSVGSWREASIPQFPARPQIDRMLESCERSNVAGARDRAILLLLARLGLRSVEVSRLELGDLHWRAGEIEIDGKGHHRSRLPLPSEVGEALVSYIRVRDRSESRRVFLTVHAPRRPLESAGVRTVVRNACRRAGIEHVAAHQLRHALASDLLREGASLVAIGQVLRHKHLESTAIYAKVDLLRLRQAVQTWPRGHRDDDVR